VRQPCSMAQIDYRMDRMCTRKLGVEGVIRQIVNLSKSLGHRICRPQVLEDTHIMFIYSP
jgi:hypothetical protein